MFVSGSRLFLHLFLARLYARTPALARLFQRFSLSVWGPSLRREISKGLADKSVFVISWFWHTIPEKKRREKGGFLGLDQPFLGFFAGKKRTPKNLWHGLVTRAPANTRKVS